jgi:P27 family predicted phage terminase small subunit
MIYCAAVAAWLEATAEIQKSGMMVAAPSGYMVQSPWVSIQRRNAELMIKLAGELGLSPAARARHFPASKRASMVAAPDPTEPLDWSEMP